MLGGICYLLLDDAASAVAAAVAAALVVAVDVDMVCTPVGDGCCMISLGSATTA